MKSILLLFLIINASFCTRGTGEEKIKSHQSDMQLLHTFKTKDGTVLGTLYGKQVVTNVYSSFLITKGEKSKMDTLYYVNRTKFVNAGKIIETEVAEEGFYGYRIELKKDTYIVIIALGDGGKNVSDNITIEWNGEKKEFELLKTP